MNVCINKSARLIIKIPKGIFLWDKHDSLAAKKSYYMYTQAIILLMYLSVSKFSRYENFSNDNNFYVSRKILLNFFY